MTKPEADVVVYGNLYKDGIMRFAEPENIDFWPSVEATEKFMKTVVALINMGFEGVRLEHFRVDENNPNAGTVINLMYSKETPEGQIVEILEALATSGVALDFDMVLEAIECEYRRLNLELPYDKKEGGYE